MPELCGGDYVGRRRGPCSGYESTVKQLTGGDRIRARRMREDFWEFAPTHKLWVCANHKPKVRGVDEAIWRRFKVVPFTVTIPEGERDGRLPAKLRAELPGILAWAVRGCLEWARDGLGSPQEVKDATTAYRVEQDPVASFLEEACDVGPDKQTAKPRAYAAFVAWCERGAERAIDRKDFYSRLESRGFAEKKIMGERVWSGFRLRMG